MTIQNFSYLLVVFFACHFAAVSALVTPETIRTLTRKMDISTIQILSPHLEHEDGYVKYTNKRLPAIRALSKIRRFLRSELDLPLKRQPTLAKQYQKINSEKCRVMRNEFDSFIASATIFLDAVKIKKLERKKPHTVGDFINEINYRLLSLSTHTLKEKRLIRRRLLTIQKLWASRKGNHQHRSFIEQQQALYEKTHCFDEHFDEILSENRKINDKLLELIKYFT